MEVAGAYSVEDCWKLVRTYEKRVPCMMLENAVGRDELMVLNMVRRGLFGEVALPGVLPPRPAEEVSPGARWHHRFRNYLYRNW